MNFKTILSAKYIIASVLLLAAGSTANAQKLKDVQTASILAPANVKVDAKLAEWNDLQAYNKNTSVYYTMANDDKNLYLAIKSSDATNNNKIIGGGINLTINISGKKSETDKSNFVIAYPVINQDRMRSQMRSMMPRPGAAVQNMDSVMREMRKKALLAFKEIKLSGFKDIEDTLISVYNEYGIKAAINYDEKGSLVYELAIPLKYLSLSADSPKEFAYNLKLNGIQFGGGGRGNFSDGPGGGGGGAVRIVGGFGGGPGGGAPGGGGFGGGPGGGMDFQAMFSPTDFWGKYIPAKK